MIEQHPNPQQKVWNGNTNTWEYIKVSPRVTHTLHILFTSGERCTYHVFSDNIAIQAKFLNPATNHSNSSGVLYLMSNKTIAWTFKHAKGLACIKTDTMAQINVEVGQVDPTKNPLTRDDHYDDPLN